MSARLGPLEKAEQWVGRLIARLPASVAVRLSGEPPMVVGGKTLDPHVQLVRALRRRRNPPNLTEPSIQAGRARFRHETRVFQWPRTPVGSVRDLEIPGPGGPLRARHYTPAGGGAALTVYLHGGGYVIGDLDTHDEACRILCREAGVQVLAIDYRLAPEHPYPAALGDTLAALRWAQAHAATLGADPARVALGGDSAGAALTTVVARETRDDRPPIAQLLIYPPTDTRTKRAGQALFGDGFFLSHADRAAFNGYYLDATGTSPADPRVSPLLAPDLGGMPPALVVSAGFDLLGEEGEAYAAALESAGTPVRHLHVPEHGHGFIHMTGVSPGAHAALVRIARAWGELLG